MAERLCGFTQPARRFDGWWFVKLPLLCAYGYVVWLWECCWVMVYGEGVKTRSCGVG